MKLLGELIKIRDNRLYIPWFHRIAPSLRTNTQLYGVLIPGCKQNCYRPELYLSPLPIDSWRDIWCLECEFKDEPGIMARLTRLLGAPEVNVNLLAHEIMTISHVDSVVGHINLICDMSRYGGEDNPDGTTTRRQANPDARLDCLIDYLTIHFWEIIRFRAHRPQIFATRLRELQHIADIAHRQGLPRFDVRIRGGVIELPPARWDDFVRNSAPAADGSFSVTVATDTDERYVKITPVPNQSAFLLLEVAHTDQPGQVAHFTELVRRCGGSIVSGYLRLQEANGLAHWRCLLETEVNQRDQLQTRLLNEFATLQRNDRRLCVYFPTPQSEECEPRFSRDESVIPSLKLPHRRSLWGWWLFGVIFLGVVASGLVDRSGWWSWWRWLFGGG